MSTGIRTIGVTGMIVLATSLLAKADTVKEVQEKIIAAAKKVKSATGDISLTTDMSHQGMTMKMVGSGTMAYMIKGDKYFSRQEMNIKTEMGEGMPTMEQSMLTIADGEFYYTLSEQMGQKMATKTEIDPKSMAVPTKESFEVMAESATLKVLPDATVDGRNAWVIEATPKQGGAEGKTITYYDQDTGLMIKMVMMKPDGTPMTTMKATNIKTNVDIAADKFEFNVPEGVTVQDMTNR